MVVAAGCTMFSPKQTKGVSCAGDMQTRHSVAQDMSAVPKYTNKDEDMLDLLRNPYDDYPSTHGSHHQDGLLPRWPSFLLRILHDCPQEIQKQHHILGHLR